MEHRQRCATSCKPSFATRGTASWCLCPSTRSTLPPSSCMVRFRPASVLHVLMSLCCNMSGSYCRRFALAYSEVYGRSTSPMHSLGHKYVITSVIIFWALDLWLCFNAKVALETSLCLVDVACSGNALNVLETVRTGSRPCNDPG